MPTLAIGPAHWATSATTTASVSVFGHLRSLTVCIVSQPKFQLEVRKLRQDVDHLPLDLDFQGLGWQVIGHQLLSQFAPHRRSLLGNARSGNDNFLIFMNYSEKALPQSVLALGATGVASAEPYGCPKGTEDTITLMTEWKNLESGNTGTAIYTASWSGKK